MVKVCLVSIDTEIIKDIAQRTYGVIIDDDRANAIVMQILDGIEATGFNIDAVVEQTIEQEILTGR